MITTWSILLCWQVYNVFTISNIKQRSQVRVCHFIVVMLQQKVNFWLLRNKHWLFHPISVSTKETDTESWSLCNNIMNSLSSHNAWLIGNVRKHKLCVTVVLLDLHWVVIALCWFIEGRFSWNVKGQDWRRAWTWVAQLMMILLAWVQVPLFILLGFFFYYEQG